MSVDTLFDNDIICVWIYVWNVSPTHLPSFFTTVSDTLFRIISIAPPDRREWVPTLSMSRPLFTSPVYLTALLTAFKICGAVTCLTSHRRPHLAQYWHIGASGSSLICSRRVISRARQATGLRYRWFFVLVEYTSTNSVLLIVQHEGDFFRCQKCCQPFLMSDIFRSFVEHDILPFELNCPCYPFYYYWKRIFTNT